MANWIWALPAFLGGATGGTSNYSSLWTGIGDGNGGELIQAGTEQDVLCSSDCTAQTQQYYLWYEAFPQESQQEITSLVPQPGDLVGVQVAYGPPYSPNVPASFSICDFTQDNCVSFGQSTPAPDNTAEWILERTAQCQNGQLVWPPLADVGNITDDYNGWYDYSADPQQNEPPISQGNPVGYNMVDDAGTVMAIAGPLDSTGDGFELSNNLPGETDSPNPPQSCPPALSAQKSE